MKTKRYHFNNEEDTFEAASRIFFLTDALERVIENFNIVCVTAYPEDFSNIEILLSDLM